CAQEAINVPNQAFRRLHQRRLMMPFLSNPLRRDLAEFRGGCAQRCRCFQHIPLEKRIERVVRLPCARELVDMMDLVSQARIACEGLSIRKARDGADLGPQPGKPQRRYASEGSQGI